MSLRDLKREPRDIPIGLIIPPELPARASMDETKLDELAHNIAKNGVIQRLIVVPNGDRYEVVAGHRRSIAARMAGLAAVPCDIYPTRDVALEALKYAENRFREDMSAGEEAIYFAELLERDCGNDIERLAELVGEKLSYVDGRLQLINGDKEIFQALLDKKISIGVAQELNKCPAEDYRRYYLAHAIKGGATISTVSGWITEWKNMYGERPITPPVETIALSTLAGPVYDPHRCYVCRKSDPRHIPEQLQVHAHCKLAILDPLLDSYHGASSES